MIIAILSDVHSNLQALDAVLSEVRQRKADAIYCLGDMVGYGADPGACLERLQEVGAVMLRGNHDEAVATETGIGYLPADGQEAARHNRSKLSQAQLQYLADLPLVVTGHGCTFAHATPERPELWQRLDSFQVAQRQFSHFEGDFCFVGHTHLPAVMSNKMGVLSVRKGPRYLINVGSVGQPRDRNPRASFGLFDPEAVTYENVRIPYDVEGASARILEEQLPAGLASRIKVGR